MSYSTNRYFDTQRWYDNLMEKRTREAIRKKMLSFEAEHENDTDNMLLNAIRDRAKELGYVPYPAECIAYKLIIRRFGSWDKALRLAHLSRPVGARRLRETNLYRQEYRNQQKLHRRSGKIANGLLWRWIEGSGEKMRLSMSRCLLGSSALLKRKTLIFCNPSSLRKISFPKSALSIQGVMG